MRVFPFPPSRSAGAITLVLAGLCPAILAAAPVRIGPEDGARFRGIPVSQSFRPDGSSVLRTADGAVCLVSARIDIVQSRYLSPQGQEVAFSDVLRSPASTVQMAAAAGQAPEIRIQLKYALAPGQPVQLQIGDAAPIDLPDYLREASGDSLRLTGALAATVASSLASGETLHLTAISRDTGRQVTDRLPAPDQTALAGCLADLASDSPDVAPAETPTHLHQVILDAAPDPERIATPGDMRACGMPEVPETLYLGRIRSVTGFVSHTDRMFVAFDAAGTVSHAWIPGIFETRLTTGQGRARISRAADGNIPGTPHEVSGCIGMRSVEICSHPLEDGSLRLGPCLPDPELLALSEAPGIPGLPVTPPGTLRTSSSTPPSGPGILPLTPGSSDSGDSTPEAQRLRLTTSEAYAAVPIAPVPLPASGLLLAGTLAGLAWMRRRRRAA